MKFVRISTRLSFFFALFFLITLSTTGIIVYRQLREIIRISVDSSLDTTSDLIKKIVETNVEHKRDEVKKDLIVAEHLIGTDGYLDEKKQQTYIVKNTITENKYSLKIPSLIIDNISASYNTELVDTIQRQTEGEVAVYQLIEEGFISVSSTLKDDRGNRKIGELYPANSYMYQLILENQPYYGRDYINGEWYFTAFAPIYQDGQVIGSLFTAQKQVKMDSLREDVLSIRIGKNSKPYIIDRASRVIVHPLIDDVQRMELQYIIDIIFQRNGSIQYTQFDEHTGKESEYIAFFKFIPEMNWVVVVGSSMKDFYGDLYQVRSFMIFIFSLATVLSVGISFFLGRQITKPITRITESIKTISEGEADFSKHLQVTSDDEIGRLASYFNTFVGKLQQIQELKQLEAEILLRDTQINALQAQINPHFLYNTLETIRFMIKGGDERAVEMVKLLADLFRVSIGRGETFVTLKREIDHAMLYISLQKIRHSDRFRVVLNIPEEFNQYYTIKFLIQPVVENCIQHGFDLIEKDGLIVIDAIEDGNKLIITITDNGTGIDEKKLRKIKQQLKNRKKTGGVGIQNVHDRIQLHFGKNYGLSISSKAKKTKVVLKLPLLRTLPKTTYILDEAKNIFNA